MKAKRGLWLLVAFALFLHFTMAEGFGATQNAESEFQIVEANNGALSEKLGVAYLSLDTPYIVKGETATWTLVVSENAEKYQYAFDLYIWNEQIDMYDGVKSQPCSDSCVFAVNIQQTGRYIARVTVYDGTEIIGTIQSREYEAVDEADEADENTVAGKVQVLAKQCMVEAGSSEYARALWLHDWLIYHADYDNTLTYYYADGVLLHGTGVCQSYALAYQMLLKAVGMDSIVIEGKANGSHSWNLVSIDGQWYHVDCTFDDPDPGNGVTHAYFGLTDALMRRDHTWSEKSTYPPCTADEAMYDKKNGAYFVGSNEEIKMVIQKAIAAEAPSITLCSNGFEGNFYDAIQDIANDFLNDSSNALTSIYQSGGNVQVILNFAYHYNDFYSEKKPTQLFMNANALLLTVGDTDSLTFTYRPESVMIKSDDGYQSSPLLKSDFVVEWQTDNPAVVSVENGQITALKAGFATVTVSCGEISASCLVRVTDATAQLSLSAKTTVIKKNAFAGCIHFTSSTLPDGLQRIESRAFAGCENLITITIPSSVIYIAPDAFDGCDHLLILCHADSIVEAFAKEHEIDVKIIK